MKISLKAARVNAELKREDVAKAMGYTTHALMRWELGETVPRADIFMALCAMYHVKAEDIDINPQERALQRLGYGTERESKNVV